MQNWCEAQMSSRRIWYWVSYCRQRAEWK